MSFRIDRRDLYIDILNHLKISAHYDVMSYRVNPEGFLRYYRQWDYGQLYTNNSHEKCLEHYVSMDLLKPQQNDTFIDIAARGSVFSKVVRETFGCKSYMQDLVYTTDLSLFRIGCDAGMLPFDDGTVSKMSLHCSFEHFEGDADTRFIIEAARVLKKGGLVCILPLYLKLDYFIITDTQMDRSGIEFDDGAFIEEVPGHGNRFGRFYDYDALKRRVLQHCEDQLRPIFYFVENEKEAHESCYLKFILVLEKL